jgi:uncharacterized membrane protein YgdD (TMEM256/DUF423 family)
MLTRNHRQPKGQDTESVLVMSLTPATIWRIGAGYGFAAVGLGAFGAHGLQGRAGIDTKSLKNWETASSYLLVHAVVLLGVSLHPVYARHRFTAPLIAAGTFLFSGSIYGLVLGSPSLRKVLGPVTPIGGMWFSKRSSLC